MSEIETEAPPTMPEAYLTDPHARNEYESKLRDHFSGRTSSDPHGNVAQFNQDMRNAGMQRADSPPTGEVDQRAIDFLNDWRRKNPNATLPQLALWERDLASILEGRRYGETPAQFSARKASAQAPAAPAAPTAADPGVFIPVTEVAAEDLHGYSLPPDLPAGIQVDYGQLSQQLEAARAAGITEQQVQDVISRLARAAK